MKRYRLITAGAASTIMVCAALLMTTSPASADANAKPKGDPHAVVASDGSTYTAPEANVSGVNSFAGSGVTVNGAERVAPAESGTTTKHGDNGQESVLGSDGRVRITGTTSSPYRAVVHITRDGNGWCTGWMINADTVATAGHCVSPGSTGGFYNGTFECKSL